MTSFIPGARHQHLTHNRKDGENTGRNGENVDQNGENIEIRAPRTPLPSFALVDYSRVP